MPGTIPDNIHLFRITHADNLPHILRHGFVTAQSPNANPDFIPIGDRTLIDVRKDKAIKLAPFGKLSDYIPFYFGPHSPMLLQIKTGNQGVTQRSQEEIIYIVSSLEALEKNTIPYIFTDGHPWDGMSEFYNSRQFLDKVDWDIVKAKHWADDEEHFDRKRRKQAELLAFKHVPVNCIEYIVTYNEKKCIFVQDLVANAGLNIQARAAQRLYY